jgi:hypothetical protein
MRSLYSKQKTDAIFLPLPAGLSHSKKLNQEGMGHVPSPFSLQRQTKRVSLVNYKKLKHQGRLSMDYSTLPQSSASIEEPKDLSETMRHSLYEAFQAIPDPRRGEGKRYPLPVLLSLLCLAKMAGETSLKGATEWVRLRKEPLATAFGLKRKAMPCQMTYKRILEAIDAQTLTDLLAAFFTRRAGRAAL